MKTILFICTGNVCRSPMAEALFRRAVSGRGEFRVLSAGLGAMDGQPPTPHSVRAMDELGVDISAQRSRMLTTELVREADLILGMTHSHVDTVVLLYPPAAEKTFLLREFDETLEPYEKDISDPIGGSYPVYVECRDQIEQGIVSLLKFMEQQNLLTGTPATQTAAVADLAKFSKTTNACLVCFEADFNFCHRSLVARAAADTGGAKVVHLTATAEIADRTLPLAA